MLTNSADIKGQELILLFKEDMAFLTREVALDFNQVQISYTPVCFKATAFWTVRVIAYLEEEQRLHVEVLSYQIGDTEFPDNQVELEDKLSEVEKVTFRNIDTIPMYKTIHGTQPIKILPLKPEVVYRKTSPLQSQTEAQREPVVETYNEPFSIPIKKVTFLAGKVAFEKKIQKFGKFIPFEIVNENIIEAHDSIKNYFENVLRTNKIQVVPTIVMTDGVMTSTHATSVEIEKIDSTFLEEVKFDILNVAGKREVLGDQQLFTLDEYLEIFVDENIKRTQLFTDDQEFFENMITKSETKHHRHLRFLSSKHKTDLEKLRFVHKPFSFVFLLRSIDSFHVVWETLDTQEATYVWTFPDNVMSLKEILKQINQTILLIIRQGKNDYLNKKEENFSRVFHDYADLQNGFISWKREMEKIVSPLL